MPKIILSCILFLNSFMLTNEHIVEVRKIEYLASEDVVELGIDLYSSKRDYIELTIYSYNKNQEKISDDYFSSALLIEDLKKTIAKIPFNYEIGYLNIIIKSNNLNEVIEEVMFPIYFKENNECNLNKSLYCKSSNPTSVIYENKIIKEKYDEIVLVNNNLNLTSFNNLLPINKIKIISNDVLNDGVVNLYIEEEIESLEIYYNKKYIIPLLVKNNNGFVSFELANNYYLDMLNGRSYENYKIDTIHDNQLLFPYINKTYNMVIELDDMYRAFSKVTLRFSYTTDNKLIGNCNNAKYCIRRSYL